MKPVSSNALSAASPSVTAAADTDARERTLAAILGVLDAYGGVGRAAARLVVGPVLPRTGRRPPAPTCLPPPPDGWPDLPLPTKRMTPTPGWGGRGADQAITLAVAVLGLDQPALDAAVEEIAARQQREGGFVPLFLSDVADHGVFRRKGYIVEYFPRSIYGPAADLRLFQERFTLAWRKWNVSALIDLSAKGLLRQRIRGLGFTEVKPARGQEDRDWERPTPRPARVPSPDVAALKAETTARGLDREADTFVLYRIIGNDLYPRHDKGQSLRNVRFILEHEPPLAGCDKRWIVNRIVDLDQEAAILDLLRGAGQPVLHLPFDWEAYARNGWDFAAFSGGDFLIDEVPATLGPRLRMRAEARLRRLKVNYAMNNNGARNVALRDGRARGKWVLPWDGNCFLTEAAWAEIVAAVTAAPHLKYFMVPMARLADNQALLREDFVVQASEEPQVLFRRDAEEAFDERYPYGRRPKVELLWRLGVPGSWDQSRDDVWDLPRPAHCAAVGQFGQAGWVARLFSGMAELEAASRTSQAGREVARNEAIIATIDALDTRALGQRFAPDRLTAYDETAVQGLADAEPGSPRAVWCEALRREAVQALGRGPYSVVDKTTLPPSGDRHDYWHPAPYWWPNPVTIDGLPYVRRDGERVPGTLLYEPGSDRYDRTRLQRLFDDTTILALAWRATGETTFAEHGAWLVRHWFVEPETRMNPHLRYAQVRLGHDDAAVKGWGIIEMKDLYFFLDAVRLLERSGALDEAAGQAFRQWLGTYLAWLLESPEGTAERRSRNNHGTAYDLQVGAITAFLGDVELLLATFRRSEARLLDQFADDGSQPHELKRTQSAHYTCFNLQLWTALADLGRRCGHDFWRCSAADGGRLRRAFDWLLPRLAAPHWPHEQNEPFDPDRWLPLAFAYRDRCDSDGPSLEMIAGHDPTAFEPLYFPHFGIKPFWLLDHTASVGRDHRADPKPPARADTCPSVTGAEWFPYRPTPMNGSSGAMAPGGEHDRPGTELATSLDTGLGPLG